jgi:antitoxin component YwqK of YwqJK toxin-antitoxin module
MMKVGIIVLISFLSILSLAQFEKNSAEPCYKRSEDRVKQRFVDWECGKVIGVVDCNDKLEFDEFLDVVFSKGSGAPYTGACETCHNNGLRENHIRFVNGKVNGIDTTYYESGCIRVIKEHVLGKEHGRWIYFQDRTSQTSWIMNFLEGEKHGEHIYFSKRGDTTLWEHYYKGILDGKKTTYYDSSKVREVIYYKKGVMNGDLISYFPDGQISKHLRFKKGFKHGKQEYFFNNASILKVENFNRGLKNGEFTTFFINGDVQQRESYKNGFMDGSFVEFYPNGKMKSEYVYMLDHLMDYAIYDEYGRMKEGTMMEVVKDEEDDDEVPEVSEKDAKKAEKLKKKKLKKLKKSYKKKLKAKLKLEKQIEQVVEQEQLEEQEQSGGE